MNTSAVPSAEGSLVGFIYKGKGLNPQTGAPAVYVGSTAQELIERISAEHSRAEFLRAPSTTISVRAVYADLNVPASGRNSELSATNEALRSQEQVVLNDARDVAAQEDAQVLNLINAARKANVAKWAARHNATIVELTEATAPKYVAKIGGEWVLKGPWLGGTFAVLNFYSLFTMIRDARTSQYAMAPYMLQDEGGVFTMSSAVHLATANEYWKNYKSGALSGQRIAMTSDEWTFWKAEAYALWGYIDWKGAFQPGLLRTDLPQVDPPASQTAA